MRVLVFVFLLSVSLEGLAVTIEFPKDELARESVLPIFENTLAVKSRLVPTMGHMEFGFASGFAMNEPFFKTLRYGGHLVYHITETHGFLLEGQLYQKGLNSNGQTLANRNFRNEGGNKAGICVSTDCYFRLEYAPQPEYHFIANYQVTAYYGKISILKNFVMNLSLYGLLGLGTVGLGGENAPALNLGLGQKFYFSKNWGLRADLGFMIYQGVNYFAGRDGEETPIFERVYDGKSEFIEAPKKPSEFESTMSYNIRISLSLIFLI